MSFRRLEQRWSQRSKKAKKQKNPKKLDFISSKQKLSQSAYFQLETRKKVRKEITSPNK